ncbi:Bile acid:sodium symporter [Rhodopseudomonas palustris BisB5]|uniref:Bile acid:sodium symporter n=1 Tax=Rhodopseudomonas palustris (strain BisB5) TaxID=316057 RepID=Q132X8_RHOPS|nr:Bile acid:sodium symporter [Rhodopseudomonas palustris BisB5]
MKIDELRDVMESRQVAVYFVAVILGALAGTLFSGTEALERAINPALALMLFVTFLQVPVGSLGQAFRNGRFFAALLLTNFVAVPVLAAAIIPFAPPDVLVRMGVLFVLLCPCIDYVVTFAHLGRGDARLLLAATPVLLVVQMLLLPLWLRLFLGADAAQFVQPEPFVHAFVWLIAIPLGLAMACQLWAAQNKAGTRAVKTLGLLPVPATAAVLFIVIAAVLPQIGPAQAAVLGVAPLYVVFAVLAPLAGLVIARIAGLEAPAGRAVAFSGATRNSLVVLPLALAVPGAIPIIPAVIVAQTLVELTASLVYIRLMPLFGSDGDAAAH